MADSCSLIVIDSNTAAQRNTSNSDIACNNLDTPCIKTQTEENNITTPSYQALLFGIVENYKEEILFLRQQVKDKDELLVSQQNVIGALVSKLEKEFVPTKTKHNDDVSITSLSSDESDAEDVKSAPPKKVNVKP